MFSFCLWIAVKPFNAFHLGPSTRGMSTSLSSGTRRLDLLSLFSSGGRVPCFSSHSILHVTYLLEMFWVWFFFLMRTAFPEVVWFVLVLGFLIYIYVWLILVLMCQGGRQPALALGDNTQPTLLLFLCSLHTQIPTELSHCKQECRSKSLE